MCGRMSSNPQPIAQTDPPSLGRNNKPSDAAPSKTPEPVSIDSSSNDEEDDSVIRCLCNENANKGMMIQCETCLVWQHSLCVGIREEKALPAHYFCELCQPRQFQCTCGKNAPNGKMIQCTQCNTWQHTACLGRTIRTLPKPYRCLVCDPNGLVKRGKASKKKDLFKFIAFDELREALEEDFNSFGAEKLEPDEVLDVLRRYCIHFSDVSAKALNVSDLWKGISILVGKSPEMLREEFQKTLQNIVFAKTEIIPTRLDSKNWVTVQDNTYHLKNGSLQGKTFMECQMPQKGAAVEVKEVSQDQIGLVATDQILANDFIMEYNGKVCSMTEVCFS